MVSKKQGLYNDYSPYLLSFYIHMRIMHKLGHYITITPDGDNLKKDFCLRLLLNRGYLVVLPMYNATKYNIGHKKMFALLGGHPHIYLYNKINEC